MNIRGRKFHASYTLRLIMAMILSLLFHFVLFLVLAFPWQIVFPQLMLFQPNTAPPLPEPERPLEFELVDTPEQVAPLAPGTDANYVSDKSAQAQDAEPAADKPLGEAYAAGQFDVPEYGQNNTEAQPEAVTDATRDQTQKSNAKFNYPESYDQITQDIATNARIRDESLHATELSRPPQSGNPDRRPLRSNQAPLREQTETSAHNLGGFSLNTYAWNWAPYLLDMKHKINRNIFPPRAYTSLGVISGESLIRFKVQRNGHVADIEILNYSGHRSLMETSVNSIKSAEPFLSLPYDFPKAQKYLEVTAHFQYLISK
ncbi:energy transducer TonB [candidate division KSB1 bacterium]|nr:energy transducer TonB [candidate division KSB1 bacterium]